MKIQIVNKKDETDVHMYDLKKALGLHAAKSGKDRTLEIYWPGMPMPMSFPDSKYKVCRDRDFDVHVHDGC